jgi:photosynthetic reaction center H subunit
MTLPARPFRLNPHPGNALEPTGDPMKDGLGAAAWATDRADRPDLTYDGRLRIQPMSTLDGWSVESRDPDPRGMTVVGADGAEAGVVTDLWVDLAEPTIRFLAMALANDGGEVLIPFGFVRVRRKEREIRVQALFGHHFAEIPRPRTPGQITLLEEDKIYGYFAGGYRYADPSRLEPIF